MLRYEEWPQVAVIWWDACDFYVRCPYYEEVHRHGFTSYASGSRRSHCDGGGGGSYRYYFPINEQTGHVAYEIDNSRALFVNVCALQDIDADSDEEEQLANEFSKVTISGDSTESASGINMYDAAQETLTIPLDNGEAYEQKSIVFAVSDCVQGRVSQIQKYFDNSKNASIFLHGRNSSGDTTLIMASREKCSAMVSLLLGHRSDVNAVNHKGRSALMEAALWGRLDNAKLLMDRGFNVSLLDCKKNRAVDLAQPTRKNQRERHLIAGGSIGISQCEPVYKEDTFN